MNNRWTCSNTSVFNINYHLIWCTKYRRPLLSGDIESRLKALLAEKAAELSITIKAQEVMPDHVQIFVHTSPVYSAHVIVQQFKGYTSRILRSEFPSLRSRVPTLWTRSYYAESVGHISEAVIRKYIEDQKKT